MQKNEVRIIGGIWRGRKLAVPNALGLRPTPDSVRETLFNWLAPNLVGATCLDVFAGTGVLGFEALSRGASNVHLIDANPMVVDRLLRNIERFNANTITASLAIAPNDLKMPAKPFDIIFLDPPYQSRLLLPTCFHLENNHFVTKGALIYLESNQAINEDELPQNWHIIKSKKTGQVFFHLAQRD